MSELERIIRLARSYSKGGPMTESLKTMADEITDLRTRLAEAQARAERAEGERDGLIVDCERLATDLEQALRQWKMYADERENEDLDKEDHIEALSYRSCVQTAKDWRDKAFSLTHPALTPAPQGRTDGESGGQICGLCDKRKPCKCLMELESDATAPEVKGGGE